MARTAMIAAASAAVLTLSPSGFAQQQSQFGTADEAKAMLLKAVAAVKADRDVALAMFNKGEDGFKDRDLFPFCIRSGDGKIVAALQAAVGTDVRTLKDNTGKMFGLEIYAAVQKPEGQNHRGKLHVSQAGHRHANFEGELRDPSERSGLRRWLLQIESRRHADQRRGMGFFIRAR